MKSLGFQGSTLALLVIGETVLLFLVFALVGISLALPFEPVFNRALTEFVGVFTITWQSIVSAGLTALAGGVLVGVGPAYSASRTGISDGLRRG
jgi:putative ABC transport system permease protein